MSWVKTVISEMLHVFGVLFLVVEIFTYFSHEKIASFFGDLWWVFLAVGIIISIVRLIPKKKYVFKLDDKDIEIELVIGDIFKQKGPIIVGSNTSQITSSEIISPLSVQGIFTNKYCNDAKVVSDQITAQLGAVPHAFGATATVRGNGRIGYFCAISELNENGVARSTLENVRVSLAELWNYLGTASEKDTINIPILGTDYGRVSSTRETIFQEIIKSFVASTSENTFCDGLRIVIHPKDIKKYRMNIPEMVKFLEYSCRFSVVDSTGTGVGLPET